MSDLVSIMPEAIIEQVEQEQSSMFYHREHINET